MIYKSKCLSHLNPTIPLNKYGETCKHELTSDFSCWSFGDNERIAHTYCHDCKGHWFRGKFYNEREWYAWINSPEVYEKQGLNI